VSSSKIKFAYLFLWGLPLHVTFRPLLLAPLALLLATEVGWTLIAALSFPLTFFLCWSLPNQTSCLVIVSVSDFKDFVIIFAAEFIALMRLVFLVLF